MKTYYLSAVCSDATTHTTQVIRRTRKEAQNFLDGMCAVLVQQGKSIFIREIKLRS